MNTTTDLPDEVLFAQPRNQKNQDAFTGLYERYRTDLLNFIRSHLWKRPESDSEDLLQQVFTEFHRVPQLLPGSTVRGLLYGIARYVITGHIRNLDAQQRGGIGRRRLLRRWTRCPLEEIDPIVANMEAARTQTRSRVYDLIDTLPPEEACAVRLVWLEGYTAAEAAETLQWPASLVRWRIRRAFTHMRKMLEAA